MRISQLATQCALIIITMDDSLEKPSSLAKTPLGDKLPEDNDEQSSDEDGGLDWTKLL